METDVLRKRYSHVLIKADDSNAQRLKDAQRKDKMCIRDRIYLEKWVEEGWDDENDCATDTYQYYNKIIIKDFAGNTISEEIGCLNQSENGDWWIS